MRDRAAPRLSPLPRRRDILASPPVFRHRKRIPPLPQMAKAKSTSVPKALAALHYLASPQQFPPKPICVLFGDEPFLKAEALAALRSAVLGDGDGEFCFRAFEGDDAEPRAVFDELATVALFGGQRMVAVNEADHFVSRYRSELEEYAIQPKRQGVLVLEVDTWPATTRLFKQLAETGLQIDCHIPAEDTVLDWLRSRAELMYQTPFAAGAAERLLEIVGPQMGRLDQEAAKLSLLAAAPSQPAEKSKRPIITAQLIEQAVGGWRAKTAWEMIDSAAAGDAEAALVQLDRLILAGENPIGLLAQMAAPLRRLAAAARIIRGAQREGQRLNVRQALEQAGVSKWPKAMDKAEFQLRQLGSRRAAKIYDWLLEADLALKGISSSPDRARLVLEQLIVRMIRQAAAAR
jgi:DNA polymerase III subunit delta